MTITHHPDQSTLMSYAAGSLDEAFAVLVSCHLEVCDHCRERVRTMEMIGGATLEQSDDAPLSEGSLGRLLEKISYDAHHGENTPIAEPTQKRRWDELPNALRHYVDRDLAHVRWKRVAPGVWQKPITLSPGNSAGSLRLLKISSGQKLPEHGHGGQELTLIIQGAYEDSMGHFGAGDVADLDDHVEHQPQVVSDQACICLAATEAPTRFKSLAGRLLQPLVGF